MIGFSQPIAEKSLLVTGTEQITRPKKDYDPPCPRIHPALLAPRNSQGLCACPSLGRFGQPIQKPAVQVPSTPRPLSRCAQAPAKVSSPTHARTHRHRYHSMSSVPKGNAGLVCQSACPRTRGFFVMIAQPTNTPALAPFSARANASVRLVASFHSFLAYSHVGRASRWISQVNSNAPRSSRDHQHGDVCSAPCHGYNPHRQPPLLPPTL